MNNDIIFALSSGQGKSGVAVIRISGENLRDIFLKFINKSDVKNRYAYFTNLRDNDGELIDQCLLVFFPAPNSFTGEDVIEIHTHGAPAVIEKIFEYLTLLGMRIATRGEFSKRAFFNNKMDLADVDGLAALLDAQTDKQRKTALKSMLGGDSDVYNSWRTQMLEISAYAAAMLDYSPDDLPLNIDQTILARVEKLHREISAALGTYKVARTIRGGINVALVGETNVGKSSIFNYMVGANRAIVSDIAGTTRDVVSATIDIDGFLVNLNDTAGLRETDDEIESIGIEKTKAEIENSDIIIRVYTPENIPLYRIDDTRIGPNPNIYVVNKIDTSDCFDESFGINVSVKTGEGMQVLMNALRATIHEMFDGAESGLVVNARTKSLLEQAEKELSTALNVGDNYDLLAEHVRGAADAIGKILGVITATEVLDTTFGQLCLGK
ncbi:MAG: tRNA uridine-5-carboxymethylaminomethyl(34) synthesis GTPase MnmE [Alphaproteobacteria bacterium]|nr:tRNA uridine-5-carboxymethylaminomethyl(34) synthesis GTPase MnmE [Alphaproteobacteria bacterium]